MTTPATRWPIRLAAVDAGARQIQGTLNGLGERCGNANLTTLIPTLLLKEPYRSKFRDRGHRGRVCDGLTRTSRLLDDILNRVPLRGRALCRRLGLRPQGRPACLGDRQGPDDLRTHRRPRRVGNARIVPMSNQAGQSNLRARLEEHGADRAEGHARPWAASSTRSRSARRRAIPTTPPRPRSNCWRGANWGCLPEFFEVKRYRVTVERRKAAAGMVTLSEAVVVVKIGGQTMLSVSESLDETGSDRGPVNALSKALAKDLGPYQSIIDDLHLVDFKVRITQGGTEAVTRVVIDSEDGEGHRWATVGVSPNIVDASFEALLDAITWKLVRDGATAGMSRRRVLHPAPRPAARRPGLGGRGGLGAGADRAAGACARRRLRPGRRYRDAGRGRCPRRASTAST